MMLGNIILVNNQCSIFIIRILFIICIVNLIFIVDVLSFISLSDSDVFPQEKEKIRLTDSLKPGIVLAYTNGLAHELT